MDMNDQRPSSSELDASQPEDVKNAILAQFHAAEYSAFMGRVSSWESLQYAAWPILIAALAFLFQVEQIDWNYRWWLGLISFLVVYVAYQGTMVNMLYSVLVIERDLRPRARELVGHENFWIYERIREKNFPLNLAWWVQWPIIVSFLVIAAVTGGLALVYGLKWQDGVFLAGAIALGVLLTNINMNAKRTKKEIVRACTPEVEPVKRTATH